MYNVAPADRPMPRWQTIVYGWYIPACLALIWLTTRYWIPQPKPSTGASRHDLAIGLMLLLYGLFASTVINAGILLALNPKKHFWLAITAIISYNGFQPFYSIINTSTGFSNLPEWYIPTFNAHYYVYNAAIVFTAMVLSLSLTLVQVGINPKAYRHWHSMIVVWLLGSAIITALATSHVGMRRSDVIGHTIQHLYWQA